MDGAVAQPIGGKRRRVTSSSLGTPPPQRAMLPNVASSLGTPPPQQAIVPNAVVSKSSLLDFGPVPAAVASQQHATRVPPAERFVMPPPPPQLMIAGAPDSALFWRHESQGCRGRCEHRVTQRRSSYDSPSPEAKTWCFSTYCGKRNCVNFAEYGSISGASAT